MYGHELFVWGVWTRGSSMKEGNVKALLLLLPGCVLSASSFLNKCV